MQSLWVQACGAPGHKLGARLRIRTKPSAPLGPSEARDGTASPAVDQWLLTNKGLVWPGYPWLGPAPSLPLSQYPIAL